MFSTNIYGFKTTLIQGLKSLIEKETEIGKLTLFFHLPTNKRLTFELEWEDEQKLENKILALYKDHVIATEVSAEVENKRGYVVKSYNRNLISEKGQKALGTVIPMIQNGEVFSMQLGAIQQENSYELRILKIEQANEHQKRDSEDRIKEERNENTKLKEENARLRRIGAKHRNKAESLEKELKDTLSTQNFTKIGTVLAAVAGEKMGFMTSEQSRGLLGSVLEMSMPPTNELPANTLTEHGIAIQNWLISANEKDQKMLFEILKPILIDGEMDYVQRLYAFLWNHNQKQQQANTQHEPMEEAEEFKEEENTNEE